MKPYVAFSKLAGRAEGSILVIARTAKEARKMTWQSGECWNVEEWTDLAVIWLRDDYVFALADQKKLAAGKPHVVGDDLLVCESCDQWGHDINVDSMCCWCGEYAGDVLTEVLGRWKNEN